SILFLEMAQQPLSPKVLRTLNRSLFFPQHHLSCVFLRRVLSLLPKHHHLSFPQCPFSPFSFFFLFPLFFAHRLIWKCSEVLRYDTVSGRFRRCNKSYICEYAIRKRKQCCL